MVVCAMCEYLLAATPYTLACHLHLTFFHNPMPPPYTSHLLITPANLVEVRAEAAKYPPHSRSPPDCLLLSSSKVAKYGPERGGV